MDTRCRVPNSWAVRAGLAYTAQRPRLFLFRVISRLPRRSGAKAGA